MSLTILFVDDEPDLRTLVEQRFRRSIRAGETTVLFAGDGLEALEVAASTPHLSLVVSDINMPRMDGLTLLARLQDMNDEIATVIVSAYGDMANIRRAMNNGASDFLTKPIDFTDLDATIAKTVRHVGALREARARRTAAERARAALARYFSPNLVERLASDPDLDLSGRRREVSVLFTDIAGFTTLVETLDPALLGDLLNGYLESMTDVVFAHGGTVIKTMGDALHVLFGAPGDQPDHAERATRCALALDAASEAFRRLWSGRGVDLGATRIGAHAGPALVGDFGGGRYFDYTAYGDVINVAARLEGANKAFGTRICVSDAVAGRVPGFVGRPVGDLVLRGRRDPLTAWEPRPADAARDGSTQAYLDAFALLREGAPSATAAFAALVGNGPDDPLANFHLRRLLNGQSGAELRLP